MQALHQDFIEVVASLGARDERPHQVVPLTTDLDPEVRGKASEKDFPFWRDSLIALTRLSTSSTSSGVIGPLLFLSLILAFFLLGQAIKIDHLEDGTSSRAS
ncbi:hypothetical protein [Ktedonospora formicarum]|uniref:hypothetical protein n=1 Tax=Ktedonospora formicarum TaxID=2778364 RepID=UPI001C691C0A|nr:hypothetical protein [Ktedonospora formicarum]